MYKTIIIGCRNCNGMGTCIRYDHPKKGSPEYHFKCEICKGIGQVMLEYKQDSTYSRIFPLKINN